MRASMAGLLAALFLASSSVYGDTGIRGVDFQNFTYRPKTCYEQFKGCSIDKVVRVRNGKYKKGVASFGIRDEVLYGHLTSPSLMYASASTAWRCMEAITQG